MIGLPGIEKIEILDLRHFSARQLKPLLEQEAALWQRTLGWDYRSSIELLLQYLDSRILPGFVATVRGRICGYAFCVYEGPKAVIGDVFAMPEMDAGGAIRELLLRHMLELLEHSPEVDRIEAQLLLFEEGTLAKPFERAGFTLFARLYQRAELQGRAAELKERLVDVKAVSPVPEPLELTRWVPGYYQATAELIHAAYAGHLDANINDQYRTLHGSLRFLHNVIRFPGCGAFEANCSWVLREAKSHALAAVVLASRIAPGTAHVTQLCVGPEWHGQRLGHLLMLQCMAQLSADGYRGLTLTVTEANQSAVRLYGELGFTTRHRFDAMVREKKGGVRIPFATSDEAGATTATPVLSAARVRSR